MTPLLLAVQHEKFLPQYEDDDGTPFRAGFFIGDGLSLNFSTPLLTLSGSVSGVLAFVLRVH